MKYDHKFTCRILLLHRNKGPNELHFEGRKKALSLVLVPDAIKFQRGRSPRR
jgi:hypothetical protein